MLKLVRIEHLLRSRAGTTAVEFALVALPFVLLLLGILEFSRVIWTKSAMQFAVEAAARCAVVNEQECGPEASMQAYAVTQMLAPGLVAGDFKLTTPACGKKVEAEKEFEFILGSFLPAPLTLRAQSCHPARATP